MPSAKSKRKTIAGAKPVLGSPSGSSGPVSAFHVVVLALLFFEVSKLQLYVAPLRLLRPPLTLTAVALLLLVAKPGRVNWSSLTSTRPAKWLLAFISVICLSVPFGISPGRSFNFILNAYSTTLLIGTLVVLSVRSTADLRRVTWSYVLACVSLCWVVFTITGISDTTGPFGYDSNDTALMMVVAVPLTVWLGHTARSRTELLASLLCLMPVFSVAVMSNSRGGFLALAMTCGFMLIVAPVGRLGAKVACLVGGLLIAGIAAPDGYLEEMATLSDVRNDAQWDFEYGRRELAIRGFTYMVSYLPFGLGVANFEAAEGTLSELARRGASNLRWKAAHNSFVEAGAELGVPGLLAFVMITFGGIRHLFQVSGRLRLDPRPTSQTLFLFSRYLSASLVGFSVAGFFLSFAFQHVPLILVGLQVGLSFLARDLGRTMAVGVDRHWPRPRYLR